MELLDQVREAIRKNIIVHPREHGKIRGNVVVKEKATHPPVTPPIKGGEYLVAEGIS